MREEQEGVEGSGAHEVRAHEESGGRARRALERRAARLALTPVGRLEAVALQTDHHSFGIASAEEVRDEGLRSCLAHNHFGVCHLGHEALHNVRSSEIVDLRSTARPSQIRYRKHARDEPRREWAQRCTSTLGSATRSPMSNKHF